MNLRSLGYRSDLMFARYDSTIEDKGDYLVIRTPSNPSFRWGNFLLFNKPPAEGDVEAWQQLFRKDLGAPPAVTHMVFGWDSPEGERGQVQPFLQAGFKLEENIVLTAQALNPPPKGNQEVVVKPLTEDQHWERATENQVLCRDADESLEGFRAFMQAKMARYRRMSQEGLGHWFAAFLGDKVVADLGVFVIDGVGRYQSVVTHPDYRRRGICGTLVYEAGRFALEELQARTLVMAADEHYHAARIYESVGFKPSERQVGLELKDVRAGGGSPTGF